MTAICCDLGTCDEMEQFVRDEPDCYACNDAGCDVCYYNVACWWERVDLRHYGREPLTAAELEPPF